MCRRKLKVVARPSELGFPPHKLIIALTATLLLIGAIITCSTTPLKLSGGLYFALEDGSYTNVAYSHVL